MNLKQLYGQSLNELTDPETLEYLTIECSTRSKKTAARAEKLIEEGNYAEALRIADPIAYQLGYNDFKNAYAD